MKYVYEVISNQPLNIVNGMGNMMSIATSQFSPLVKRDEVRTITDVWNVTASLELKERIEGKDS